jgi:hypothetical protein
LLSEAFKTRSKNKDSWKFNFLCVIFSRSK